MKLIIAGKEKECRDGITIAELVELEQVEAPEYITVSRNDDFVERGAFGTTVLTDGDQVEFLYFMGGGS